MLITLLEIVHLAATPQLVAAGKHHDDNDDDNANNNVVLIDPFRQAKSPLPFKGFGTSLAWWGTAVSSNSAQATLYADLFFTGKNGIPHSLPNPSLPAALPGLNCKLARYNLGGMGRKGDAGDVNPATPSESAPRSRLVEGFWKNWDNEDPASNSWDFTRDGNQRAMLRLAADRGVEHIEFFSNAPMWWMTEEKSSQGGKLQEWNQETFAKYAATVAQVAQQQWNISVESIEMFNEPSANWWTLRLDGQEGCSINRDDQASTLGALKNELDKRSLSKIMISSSDENDVNVAIDTLSFMKENNVPVAKVNTHGYSNGLDPFRDNGQREKLRSMWQGELWMSEYGDGDGTGETMALSILQDLKYLKPQAWVYWQMLEESSSWGFLNGDYSNGGTLTTVNTKYFVFAHFSRFVEAGDVFIDTDKENLVVAYNPQSRYVKVVVANFESSAVTLHLDFSKWSTGQANPQAPPQATGTKFDGSMLFQDTSSHITLASPASIIDITLDAKSIQSIKFENQM